MTAILLAKLKHLLRNPWTFLGFTGICIVFALIMGLTGFESRASVPVVIADEEVTGSSILTTLNDEESISFKEMEEDALIQSVKEGKAEVGAILKKDTYELIVGVESTTVTSLDNMMRQAYTEYGQRQKIIDHIGDLKQTENAALQKEIDEALKNPVFSVTTSNFTTGQEMMYDPIYQFLFGFSLFFVIYTVAYNVLPILIEKQEGVWDRLILSPVKKWKMYAGNMIYSFCIGYLQILIIFSFFYFVFGVDFNGECKIFCVNRNTN
ncbi:ABC transporter permease [Virgibacillus dokdonensis]|uniref:ABC transporter permease n=1 Tax=Virgibacillus dokdonensis TaxID=302167 RepID=UPI00098A1A90|nr:ABC transporter permease [Virgibacillus dokdonensis]